MLFLIMIAGCSKEIVNIEDSSALVDSEEVCVEQYWFLDADGDGYGDTDQWVKGVCDAPAGYTLIDADCDDQDPTTYPGAPELCDGLDNDCDGDATDMGLVTFWSEGGVPEPYDRKFSGQLLALSNPGTLRMCDGMYKGQIRVSTTGLTVESMNGPMYTHLDAQGAGNVVSVEDGAELTMSGITLTGGDASRGGGLTCIGAAITLNEVTIYDNHAEDGGGINAEQGCSIFAEDVSIWENQADDLGGGIRLDSAVLLSTGINLALNSAGEEGGGMYAQSSSIFGSFDISTNRAPLAAGLSMIATTGDMSGLMLNNNIADDDGGGVFLRDSTLFVGEGLANKNVCDNAGAAFLLSGTSALTLEDMQISENVARQGAGVWLGSASSFTWRDGSWSSNDPDDVYHGGKSWDLTDSSGGTCVAGSCSLE